MDVPSIADALRLADQYGIGWLFALGEAILLILIGRWLATGKLVPGSALEKAEAQRDKAIDRVLGSVDALERSSEVMQNMKPAELPAPESKPEPADQDGGG